MARLSSPPKDLRGFPRRTLRRRAELFRIHARGRSPWWFSSLLTGRFDLPAPGGTCYLAHSPAGAFVEVFRDFSLVASADIAVRVVSTVHPQADLVLADYASSRARGFGVTAAIHTTRDYAVTQAWASALRDQGFGGIRYLLGHDPSAREIGVALFGAAGETQGRSARDASAIGEEILHDVERRFGIRVVPTP